MVASDNPTVQRIAGQVNEKYGFIPILLIIPVIIDAIKLLWECAKPRNAVEGQQMLANNFVDGAYKRIILVFMNRNIIKSAKKQGVSLTLDQANDIARMILDGVRTSEHQDIPDFNLI